MRPFVRSLAFVAEGETTLRSVDFLSFYAKKINFFLLKTVEILAQMCYNKS